MCREDVWKTPIDARNNYWGFNETIAVSGRIRDRSDEPHLLEVDFRPFQMNNRSILSGKCPPGWDLVADTCYIYIGAPMTFHEAREFCRVRSKHFMLIVFSWNLWLTKVFYQKINILIYFENMYLKPFKYIVYLIGRQEFGHRRSLYKLM